MMLATSRIMRAAAGVPKKNITGFNMRHLKEATGTPRYDPWERASVNPKNLLPDPERPGQY